MTRGEGNAVRLWVIGAIFMPIPFAIILAVTFVRAWQREYAKPAIAS